jgi:(S)-2-hydroxyglutarate dehydrogenase
VARYDVAVIGAGIVGLATAMSLLEQERHIDVVVLDKEPSAGQHQTGHNSGVIHTGIYYDPTSLKARLCREGCEATKYFCRQELIRYDTCGKLIVATDADEVAKLGNLYERARANGVAVDRLDAAALTALEPNVTGIAALLVRDAGIVDYRQVCEAMVGRIRAAGGEVRFSAPVTAIEQTDDSVAIKAGGETLSATRAVACAGLHSDRLAAAAGVASDYRILPFRGEYFVLPDERSNIVRHLIYPVPDPKLPFLGIHLTRTIDGRTTVGPNAVLGFAREAYRKSAFSLAGTFGMMIFPGSWRLLARQWRAAVSEYRNSLFRSVYLAACQKYCPSLRIEDLTPWPAGVRAQAVSRQGVMLHDFAFAGTERMLHVLNAPSPAATSAIPIGRMIAARLLGHEEQLG